MLDVRHGGRHGPERRRIQRPANEGESQHAGDAAADLESSRVDVLVRDAIAGSMEHETEHDRTQPGADQGPAGRTRGDVHGDDHSQPTRNAGRKCIFVPYHGRTRIGRGRFHTVGGVKARLIGINHVALEVGNVEEALDFYGRIFEFELRGRAGRMAFLDMGDQFIALAEGRSQPPDDHRHFGLVVDDVERALAAARNAGAEVRGHDIRDPWGNNLQVVAYEDVQFTKTPAILEAMGVELAKSEQAREEIRRKLGPDAAS